MDTQATTAGLTLEEHSVHNKWRKRVEYQNTKNTTAMTLVSECTKPFQIDCKSQQPFFCLVNE